MKLFYKLISQLLIVSMMLLPFSAQAGIIGTDQVVASAQDRVSRDKVLDFVGRTDVVKQFESLGISAAHAQDRVNAMTQEEINDAVEDAHRNNWQMGIHANGDVTIDMVLKAYERVLTQWPHPDRRHRIEHCTLINPALLRRIKATGSIPTPVWTYVYYHGEKWAEYGEEKTRSMFAHRSFLDAGINVVGASDYGPGPFEPLMAIQSMVTRTDYRGRVWGANQRVTVDEALRIATSNGSRASYEEKLKGTITAGKLADFVLLEKDPHDVPADTIKDIRIARTVAGGRTTYEG